MAMVRSVVYQDSIIGSVRRLVSTMEVEMGSLVEAQAPVAMVVRDVLAAIGIPDEGIVMAMGFMNAAPLVEVDDLAEKNMLSCCRCDEMAAGVFSTPAGDRLLCPGHGNVQELKDWRRTEHMRTARFVAVDA